MAQFRKHYSREEARQLLPLLTQWLDELSRLRTLIQDSADWLTEAMQSGDDLGGETVDKQVKALVEAKQILLRFEKREIQVKDIDRGLIDFPAYIAGREVFLCWEKGEEDIGFWHDLTSGYAGREML